MTWQSYKLNLRKPNFLEIFFRLVEQFFDPYGSFFFTEPPDILKIFFYRTPDILKIFLAEIPDILEIFFFTEIPDIPKNPLTLTLTVQNSATPP